MKPVLPRTGLGQELVHFNRSPAMSRGLNITSTQYSDQDLEGKASTSPACIVTSLKVTLPSPS